MKISQKMGQFLLCPVPMIFMFFIQFLCTTGILLFLAIFVGPNTFEDFFYIHYTFFLTLIKGLSLALFGTWYYLTYYQHRPIPRLRDHISFKRAVLLFLLGFVFYCTTSILFWAASLLSPQMLADYELMIAESGLADLTFFSTLTTLLLAPLSEELVFRGITYKFAYHASGSFWTANIIQALLFGISHLNWIQGIYAFVLGLLLGYICKRCNSLYAGIILHFSFNFFGTYFVEFITSPAFYPK